MPQFRQLNDNVGFGYRTLHSFLSHSSQSNLQKKKRKQLMPMPVLPAAAAAPPLFRIELNQRIDPHDRNTRLDCTLQLPHFTHTGLQHAGLDLIDHFAPCQIEPVILVVLALGDGVVLLVGGFGGRGGGGGGGRRGFVDALGGCVVGAELGDEVGGVFGGVDGEGAGDDEEGLCELADGELFAGALGLGVRLGWVGCRRVI